MAQRKGNQYHLITFYFKMMNAFRIKSWQVWKVRVPYQEGWTSTYSVFGPHGSAGDRTIIRIEDEDGFFGWGETTNNVPDETLKAVFNKLLEPMQSAGRHSMWPAFPNPTYFHQPLPPSEFTPPEHLLKHRLRHPLNTLFEMAYCDLVARRANVPLSTLFGGRWRDRVSVDYWMGRTTPEDAAKCAKRGYELGFRGIKLKTTLEDPNVERLEAIKDAVGENFHVTVDPNGRFYRLDDALKTILAMDKVGNMGILEDPFARFHLQEFATLRPKIQARLVLHIDPPEMLHQVVSSGAVGGLNIDSHTQGLFAWRMQAATADQFNLPVWHGSGLDLGIYTAAQLQIASATPNCNLPGDQVGPWLRQTHLMKEDFKVEEGMVIVPDGPGLGIEVDLDALDQVTQSKFAM